MLHCPVCHSVVGRTRECPIGHRNPFDALKVNVSYATKTQIECLEFAVWRHDNPETGDMLYKIAVALSIKDQHLADANERIRQLSGVLRKLAQSDDAEIAKIAQAALDDETPYDGNVARW